MIEPEGIVVSDNPGPMATAETDQKAGDKLQHQLRECWRRLPNKPFFFAAFALWCVLFSFLGNSTMGFTDTHSLFGWMYYVYTTSPDDEHCLFIPVVVLALFWWKREQLLALPSYPWWPATWLVLLGLLLHIGGYMAQQTRVSIVGFFVGLYGIMGMAWGWHWLRGSFFPFFLFAFCVPLAAVSDDLTFPLRLLVSQIAAGIGHLLGIEVIRVGTQLYDPQGSFNYDVAAACSGIRSLTVLLALTTVYGFVTFKATWKRVLMVLIAIPLAILGNVTRLTGVIMTAEAFGEQAGMRFHDVAGFVTFLVALGCVLALGAWLAEDNKSGEEQVV